MKKLENDEHLARETMARQDILKKVDDNHGHSNKIGDYLNGVSLAAESELTDLNEEYYNGKEEKLKNRRKLKNHKTKGTKVKSCFGDPTKSQSDETKSLSDDYSPHKIFRSSKIPEIDFEAKRNFACNRLFDFFNLVDSNSDSSERDSEGTFLYKVSDLKGFFFCLINFC